MSIDILKNLYEKMKKVNLACIIDDDPIFIFATRKIMQLTDFCNNVIVYNNGFEAVSGLRSKVKENKLMPEVIFLDLNMPILDGWGFLDNLKEDSFREDVTIFIVSSSINQVDMDKAKQYGYVADYIFKPLKIKDLNKILEGFIN